MPRPRVAVGPETAPGWVRGVVENAGAEVVPVEDAEALVWVDPFDVALLQKTLAQGPNVRWVQLPWAGVEDFAAAGVFDDDRLWTCGKGVYAAEVAEHALALALAGLRDLPDRVRATSWAPQSGRSLINGKVTILGAGGITEWLVALLAPFKTEVTVVRRRGDAFPNATRTHGIGRLHEALECADVVVLALALTPETAGVIAAPELAAMQDHAWLINVARGKHVVTDDLVVALQERRIGGAGLDVTDPEPLPDGHPLWDLPNCIITPHTANTAEMARPVLSARITENIRRFAADEELVGPVDPSAGY